MKTHEKRNPWNVILGIVTAILTIFIIVLLVCLSSLKKGFAESENSKLELTEKLEISQKLLAEKNKEIDSLNNVIFSLTCENEMLRRELEICLNSKKSNENFLSKEISGMKKDISNISEKLDSLKYGFDVKMDSLLINHSMESSDSTEYSDSSDFDSTSVIVKDLSFVVTKTVYNKKGTKVVEESKIKNHEVKRFYIPGLGWYADTLYTTYDYMNENNDSVKIGFKSVVNGERYYLDIRENKTKVLFFDEERTPLGAGGLPSTWDYLSWKDQFRHMEKFVNTDLQKQGAWEIAGGILVGGLGGVGYWYFDTHPRAKINVYSSNGELIYSTEISNDLGKGLSSALVGIGAGLTTKGAIDLLNSVRISPTEISFVHILK